MVSETINFNKDTTTAIDKSQINIHKKAIKRSNLSPCKSWFTEDNTIDQLKAIRTLYCRMNTFFICCIVRIGGQFYWLRKPFMLCYCLSV